MSVKSTIKNDLYSLGSNLMHLEIQEDALTLKSRFRMRKKGELSAFECGMVETGSSQHFIKF